MRKKKRIKPKVLLYGIDRKAKINDAEFIVDLFVRHSLLFASSVVFFYFLLLVSVSFNDKWNLKRQDGVVRVFG